MKNFFSKKNIALICAFVLATVQSQNITPDQTAPVPTLPKAVNNIILSDQAETEKSERAKGENAKADTTKLDNAEIEKAKGDNEKNDKETG